MPGIKQTTLLHTTFLNFYKMKKVTETNPLDINDADGYTVAEYGYYCDEKIAMDEVPFSFSQWMQANEDMKDED